MKYIWRVLILTVVAFSLSATAYAQAGTEVDSLPQSVMTGDIRGLDGKVFKLSDGAEKLKIIVLWASWCGPCKIAVEDLSHDRAVYAQRGVEIIALTIEDPAEDEQSVRRYVLNKRIIFKIGWANEEMAKSLAGKRNIVPQLLVVTKDGRVIKRFLGYMKGQTLIALRNAVELNL